MSVLIDTSAWIDYFNPRETAAAASVARALAEDDVVLGDLVLVELLQGIRQDRQVGRTLEELGRLERASLCGPVLAELAAANYRLLRRKGLTIRGTIDVIIATWCIANRVAIIHNDRDLAVMERELGLVAYSG
ncbi:ribonuclease VapC [Aureimonas endophytica]|uniref:Ribonuclease VapC n=1 Tax=Aureimonas endophytica TaxID=2027858 RepID=A0A916ZCD5_9HYPH|nr:PIN domain-containing protein [Aureimonas endophytica]GGD85726.1 ribonuclease VapC [Aureimonas endophytica]